jgi:hypothetical protein
LTAFPPKLPKTAVFSGFWRFGRDSVAFAAESRNAKKLIYSGFGIQCRGGYAIFRAKRRFF